MSQWLNIGQVFVADCFQKMYDKTIVEFSFYELRLSELSNLMSV